MTRLFIVFLVGFIVLSCEKEEETQDENYNQSSADPGTFYHSYITGTITDSVSGMPVSGKVIRMIDTNFLPHPKDSIENGSYLLQIARREGGGWTYPYPSEMHLLVFQSINDLDSGLVIGDLTIPIGQLVDDDTLVIDFEL